jgi:hypothetical protein
VALGHEPTHYAGAAPQGKQIGAGRHSMAPAREGERVTIALQLEHAGEKR